MEKIKNKILEYKLSKISLKDLQSIINESDYLRLFDVVKELENEGILKPVKNSGANGCNPPLYEKYHIIYPKNNYAAEISEINALHHLISVEKYRLAPNKYAENRFLLYPLSEYLKSNINELKSPMSENERAYSIWKDEKILDIQKNINILKNCGVFEILNTYPTPEPFFDYRTSAIPKSVLIIENKDTWFTLRKLMLEKPVNTLFGTYIDCIVYGEGKKAAKPSSIYNYLSLENSFSEKVYYWGDIDYEGIEIFLSIAENNPNLNIELFAPAYSEMLNRFYDIFINETNSELFKCRKNQRKYSEINSFFNLLDDYHSKYAKDILEKGYYIPQEILNYNVLKERFTEV